MNETRLSRSPKLDRLRQERDELRVRMHLARAELRDEWDEIERKWARLEAQTRSAARGAHDMAHRTLDGPLGALADEIGKAYRRLRHRLH